MGNSEARALAWRAPSLRGRVTFLAGTVVVLLAVTLLLLIGVLRSSQANLVAQSNKHLEAVVRALAHAYETRSDRSIGLSERAAVMPPPPPPKPPGQRPPPKPPAIRGDPQLTALTARVLQDETGIEGGYFRQGEPPLVGYAFPTHEGPGDTKVLPARETPLIANLAAAALSQAKMQESRFDGTHDVVLFIAAPVCETTDCVGRPVGAAWLMQRLADAETDRKRALLWSAFGFGIVACITVILAFAVLRQVDRGTHALLNRLAGMERDLSANEPRAGVGLAEFHRVMDGLERLRATLRSQFERERELQTRLRQSERLAAVGQLAAGVAHDLRNPLATIRLRAQMAQRRTSDEPTVQTANVILAEVDRLDATIERLLNFSRPVRPNLKETDLCQPCAEAVERWQARAEAITFCRRGDGRAIVMTDEARVQQVLDNLIENAVHQLTERKIASAEITIACGQDEGQNWIEVRDNGGGFSQEALRSGLEPFFTTRAKGTGLGLAICNEILQALGGKILLSNGASGAVVRLEFSRQVKQEQN